MLTDKMNIFECEPHNDLLSDRSPNGAYCIARPGKEYAVYFPDGGRVKLDTSALTGPATIRWLDIMKSQWSEAKRIESTAGVELACPSQGYWAVLIK
jgi:hypothetical protein